MEEELKQLQNEVDELRKGFTKSKELIDERINNRMEDLEKENRDIYSDQEIANLNMGLQRIEKEVNKKLEKLLSQIEEINEFENGKKEKIDELNKKINEKIDKLTEQGYSYSDVYLDEEIQNLQAEIESIKKEKIVTKAELNEARNDYQGLKTEKQKLENEIVITVIATGFTKTAFQDLKLDSIVGEALKNATVTQNTQPTSTSAFSDMNTMSGLNSQSDMNSSSSISSTRTNITSNNEYKMVDLDIPPFLRRNKD